MKLSTVATGLLLAFGALPCAHADEYDQVRKTVAALNPSATIHSITPTPIAGLVEVVAEGSVVYLSEDGRYMVAGEILDFAARENLTDTAMAGARARLLEDAPRDRWIRFGPSDAESTVFVFTDTSCGYCARFHDEVPALNAAGVAVEYIPWPRGGLETPAGRAMNSAWCNDDPRSAYDALIAGASIAPADCDAGFAEARVLARSFGVEGTPAIYDANGRQLGGYLQADALLNRLSR